MKKLWLLLLFLTLVNADTLKQAVSASQVQKNVAKVMAVYDWNDSLAKLQEEAQKKNKMIFWLQVVGELDGGL